jgi:NAD(P)-dependent dehydrogenase (short-subunit alcohol dehydrogenase family)
MGVSAMGEYSGRTAVITGAGSGLGAAMAEVFAAAGAKLALLDID